MFRKPFKVKSNSLIKGSDRKKLRSHLLRQFPQLEAEDINLLVPNKDEIQQVKIITHNATNVLVYVASGNPVFFEVNDFVFPTVYVLWSYPDLLPSFPTWSPIFDKLSGGADLMLPGVVLDGVTVDNKICKIQENQICCVNLMGNLAAVAVGKSCISAEILFGEQRKGKAVLLMHVLGDHLWAMGDKSEPPTLAPVSLTCQMENLDNQHFASNTNNDDNNVDAATNEILEKLVIDDAENFSKDEDQKDDVQATVEAPVTPEIMDELLIKCLLTSIKTTLKKAQFPLLVSSFHKSHLLASCPANQNVNVKKSSYKKLSTFLKEMQIKGLLEVKELQKGVESIVSVNFLHEMVQSFRVEKPVIVTEKETETEKSKGEFTPPTIRELFAVSAAVLPLFSQRKLSKGAALAAGEVRQFLKDYVKEHKLQNNDDKSLVILDPILAHVLLAKGEYAEQLNWEDLQAKCLSKMSPAHEIIFSDKSKVFKKGTLAPIELKTAQRSGNKKVTLVYNLETYGIDPDKFAHQVQVGVAASTSVTAAPNMKSTQVLIQGNQIKYVGKLLLDDYQIPRKYISGLDKHAATGKKKS